MSDEPLLKEDSRTFSLFPQVPGNMERVQENMHHLLDGRGSIWKRTNGTSRPLTQGEKQHQHRAGLFSSADSIVNLNSQQFLLGDQGARGRVLFAFQAAQENIHAEVTPCSSTASDKDEGRVFEGKGDDGVFQCDTRGSTRTVPN